MATSVSYIYWRGGKFNRTSVASLLVVERLAGPIRVVQGGYNAGGVAASAGTHDGGGVVDISTAGMTRATVNKYLKYLRLCGWAAWYRTPAQGFVYHIHAVRIGDNSASWGAKAQVVSYRNGRNGLAGNGYDDGPRVGYVTWAKSKYNPANAPKKPTVVKNGSRGKILIINGKKYQGFRTVTVAWVNQGRAANPKKVNRAVYVVQGWLRRPASGGYYKGKQDGLWGSQTQAAFDNFRRKKLGWTLKSDYTGPVGLSSLTKLGDIVNTKYKVAAK